MQNFTLFFCIMEQPKQNRFVDWMWLMTTNYKTSDLVLSTQYRKNKWGSIMKKREDWC